MEASTDDNTRWRYRCPIGHTQWRSKEIGYHCIQCRDNGDEPHFNTLRDMKDEPLRY